MADQGLPAEPAATRSGSPELGWACALMALSGAAGLAWQMAWTLQLGVALGHEIVAVLGITAAVFAGFAVGAGWMGDRIERSRWPGRWYALLEAGIGVWGIGAALCLPDVLPLLSRALGEQPTPAWHALHAWGLPLLLLLPATAAMGATLPALTRQLGATTERPLPLGPLYAANTAGAVMGVLLTSFVLLPAIGLRAAGLAAGGANLLCAAIAWRCWSSQAVPEAPWAAPAAVSRPDRMRALGLLMLSGWLGIGYQALCLRVLAQVTENTVYSQAVLLTAFLLGTALGAALFHAWQGRGRVSAPAAIPALLVAMPFALAAGGLALLEAPWLAARPLAGAGPSLAGEALAGLAAMVPPTLVMGALFSAACQAAAEQGLRPGRAVALNAGAAALAPAGFGTLLVPALGAVTTLALLAAGYVALAVWHGTRSQRPSLLAAGLVTVAAIALLPPLRFVDLGPQERLVWHRDGGMGAVSVVVDEQKVSRLHINNRVQEGSSASGSLEARLAWLPLLTHPAPQRALVLGLGTGYTAYSAAMMPGVAVDAVELLPEVIEASRLFMAAPSAPTPLQPPRILAADARRFVQADGPRYDVIVADLFHPARAGAGSLYTVEHFAAVRQRLAPGGVFCQWLALHQMEMATLDSIVAAFGTVFPGGVVLLAGNSLDTPVVGLWAAADGGLPRRDTVAQRLAELGPALGARLDQARLVDATAVLGNLVGGPDTIRRMAARATPNSDDRPVVSHRAPWDAYGPRTSARQRLEALLDTAAMASARDPARMVAGTSADQARALSTYWSVRDRYLRIGMALRPEADAARLLARMEGPLSRLLDESPQFMPAADALAGLRAAATPR
jgi:spermidine synthase